MLKLKKKHLLVYGVKKFHIYLYGRLICHSSDRSQAPLNDSWSRQGNSFLAAARLQRWAWILSAYRYDIEFNDDGLSRLPLSGCTLGETGNDPAVFNLSQMEALPVTVTKLRGATVVDRVLSKVYHYVKFGWPDQVSDHLRPFYNRRHELTLE